MQLLVFSLSNLSGFTNNDAIHHLGHYVSGSPITAAANKVTLLPGHEIALRCNILEHPEASFKWYKRKVYPLSEMRQAAEEERVELTSKDPRYLISKDVMIIKSSTLEDVGDYFCQVEEQFGDVAEREKMISVRLKPMIQEFDLKSSTFKSAIVEVGQPLKISCNVVDDYFSPESLNITWHMSKYDENDMNDIHSGEDDLEIVPNNRTSLDLRIGKVTEDHRRLYKCHVSNGVTENSKSILIRVKNKYTVIWPAVGIVIELVILIGVIIVVENRRVEPDKGAYDRKAIHQM
jgi:hypothetical protein